MTERITVENLDEAIERYKLKGYRLDMIFPADDPREAVMSFPRAAAGDSSVPPTVRLVLSERRVQPPADADDTGTRLDTWIRGRAGMEYRDLVANRLGGKVIASHIRLKEGGPVPDYVHYHKIDFQVIYCRIGRIKVVYEDQGEPFWLGTGDLVLQPPEIRHRVLECNAGAEVIEITAPAEHETWVDHEMELPNGHIDPDRLFGGRRFFRHRSGEQDGRDVFEKDLVSLAERLGSAASDAEIAQIAITFSQSLCRA